MFNRDRIRNWLIALGWIALFLAVMPFFEHDAHSGRNAAEAEFVRDHPDLQPSSTVYRFGWSGSPLVVYESEQSVEVRDASGFSFKRTSGVHIGWLSWSSLTLVIGLILLRLARWFKASKPTPGPGGG